MRYVSRQSDYITTITKDHIVREPHLATAYLRLKCVEGNIYSHALCCVRVEYLLDF